MSAYVIGVDGGTESLRAGVFDLAGNPLAFASARYPTEFPRAAWAEQDPRDWWTALGRTVREAVADSGVRPDQVKAIALDTTCCSVVALDDTGKALGPALIWMDLRSADQAAELVATGDPALAVNSDGAGPVSAEWMIPKALWLKRNEPDTFANATWICEYQDYLNYHLTGRMVGSINNCSVRWHYNARRGGAPTSLMAAAGIPELADKWPREIVGLGEVVGPLTDAAAEHLGLPPGTPVAQGGADAFIGMIGLGVVEPGRMAFITGSSHLHLGLSAGEFHGAGIWGTYPDAVIPGLHVVEGGQTSTGSAVAWYRNLLGENVDYDALTAEAVDLPPGSDGLVVLDHFQGNRTPYTDPRSRGVISGLSLSHKRGHVFRAIIEGIAYGTELILETMRNGSYTVDDIRVAGGATRSDLWLQIHADVSNVPLSLTRVADAPALGSAILAAVGAGLYDDIRTASAEMVEVVRTIEPGAGRHAAYRPFYEAYKKTYPALADILHAQAGAG
ncbi:MAG: FGGY-family carbohydrate kinase [Azospirillaceae bacterium]